MDANLATVIFSLAAAVSWGAGDFGGGLATRRARVFSVLIVMHTVGLLLLFGCALAWAEPLPSLADVLWGIAAGLSGLVALAALYRALATGRMGITAPLIAVLSAIFPLIFGLLVEGLPGTAQIVGFGFAMASMWFVSRPEEATGRIDNLGLIVISGLGFGAFGILIDRVSEDAVFWPLVASRIATVTLTFAIALTSRQPWRPARELLPLMVLAGILDTGGNVFFLLAIQAGRLDVSVMLASLYPAFTVLLARFMLKEQVTRPQAVGIVAALIAIPLIAA